MTGMPDSKKDSTTHKNSTGSGENKSHSPSISAAPQKKPEGNNSRHSSSSSHTPSRYQMPLYKIIVYGILTFGIYAIYWTYHAWRSVRDAQGRTFSPFFRTLLVFVPIANLVMYYKLFKNIDAVGEKAGKERELPAWVGLLIFLFAGFLLFPLYQNMLNYYWRSIEGKRPRHSLSGGEIVAMLLGVVFFLVYIGFFVFILVLGFAEALPVQDSKSGTSTDTVREVSRDNTYDEASGQDNESTIEEWESFFTETGTLEVGEWQEFRYPDNYFAVRLPGEPVSEPAPPKDPPGTDYFLKSSVVDAYSIYVSEVGAEKAELSVAQENQIFETIIDRHSNANQAVEYSGETVIDGIPGRELVIETTDGYRVYSSYVIHRDKLYQFNYVSTITDSFTEDTPLPANYTTLKEGIRLLSE